VSSPFADITDVVCYSGPVGGDDGLCGVSQEGRKKDETATFSYPEVIEYGDNFTIAVALDPGGTIVFPSHTELFAKAVKDNFFLFFIPLPAIIMFLLWYKKGRDWMFLSQNVFNTDINRPKRLKPLFYKHRTPLVYAPLKITPGEAGAIYDERIHNKDIVAEILNLARKKYLKIEGLKSKNFLSGKYDYKFTRLKEADKSLPEHQAYLLDAIFKSKKSKKLSDLKGSFYKKMTKTREMMAKSLKEQELFTSNHKNTRLKFIMIGGFLEFVSAALMMFGLAQTGSGWPALLFVIQSLFLFAFVYNMPQKTAVGTNYSLQSRGLRRTIKLGAWREKIKEKHLFIEEIFPYAVSLGVVKKLAKDMEALGIEPPSYVQGLSSVAAFRGFASSFASQTASSMSYNPSSSGWSGGSGFSGGFSGGGGGGGGGGGW
jgi:uncharacterized membrane protein YgcG